jgi:hypothetical protein
MRAGNKLGNWAIAISVAGLILVAAHATSLWSRLFCPFHAITGLYCPACGITRATAALFHGDIGLALHMNALLILGLPVILYLGLRDILKSKRLLPPAKVPPLFSWACLAVTCLFWFARNLPWWPFEFLAPR